MNRAIATILATVVVFGAGLGAGMWIQRSQPFPPPPGKIMEELSETPSSEQKARPAPAKEVAHDEISDELKTEIEKLKVDIATFRKRLDPIKTEFNEGFVALLTPAQLEIKAALEKKRKATTPAEQEAAAREQDQIRRRVRDPLDHMIPVIIVETTLDQIVADYKLSPEQRAKLKDLLIQRRDRFLQLVDQTPPPSLKLTKIAPLVVGKPAGK